MNSFLSDIFVCCTKAKKPESQEDLVVSINRKNSSRTENQNNEKDNNINNSRENGMIAKNEPNNDDIQAQVNFKDNQIKLFGMDTSNNRNTNDIGEIINSNINNNNEFQCDLNKNIIQSKKSYNDKMKVILPKMSKSFDVGKISKTDSKLMQFKDSFLTNNSNNNYSSQHNSKMHKFPSFITFSNMKVKSDHESSPEFDTEVVNTQEIKLSGELFWNKELVMDRMGIKISKRKKNKGTCYFGIIEEEDVNGNPVNDFIINLKYTNKNNNNDNNNQTDDSSDMKVDYLHNNNKSIFSIEYDRLDERFRLNVLSKHFKILHLINYDFYLFGGIEKTFIIGKIPIEIYSNEDSPEEFQNDNQLMIKIKIKDSWKNFTFTQADTPITIGRSNSTVSINNPSISKKHCQIEYSNEHNLYYLKDLGSLNGTYLIMNYNNSLQIINEMKFKINETKFKIEEIDYKGID